MPTVSIITPTYNRFNLLPQAIQSVLAQTFADFEMLIIDDGSEPGIEPVVNEFADKRLIYLHQKHSGRSIARNLGLQAARGEFIAFLDDDDLFYSQKFAHEVAFFHKHPQVDIISSGFRLIDAEKKRISVWKPWLHKPDLNAGNCLYGCPLASCASVFRSSALMRMDHWFDPAFFIAQTDDFFLRMLLSGARFEWLKMVLSDYRLMRERPNTFIVDMYNAYHQVLIKILDNEKLPPNISSQRQDILLRHTLNSAWRAYAFKMVTTGQRFLLQALLKEPRLANDQVEILLDGISYYACHNQYVNHDCQYIDYVLDHLPSPLRHLAEHRQKLHQGVGLDMSTR